MARNVGEREVFGTNQLNGWPSEHSVVFFTNESGILDSFMNNVVHILRKHEKGMYLR